MVDRYRRWLDRKTAERCAKNLKRNGFDARLVPTPEAGCREILSMIPEFETFGIGGSETIRQIGIIAELKGMGKTIHDHWQTELSPDEVQMVRLAQGRCDCFMCSANALSVQGEIVNMDGIGNRVAAMTYGPRQVIIVAGVNKRMPVRCGLKAWAWIRPAPRPVNARTAILPRGFAESPRFFTVAPCRPISRSYWSAPISVISSPGVARGRNG